MPTPIARQVGIRGIVALPGYFIADTPWAGVKAATGFDSREQGSAVLSGGRWFNSTSAQNDEFTEDHYLSMGTYKAALIFTQGANKGIHHIQFDGSDIGTIDAYAGSSAHNVYSEIAGVSVTTAGVKVVKNKMATKNASSSSFEGAVNTWSFVRTGA